MHGIQHHIAQVNIGGGHAPDMNDIAILDGRVHTEAANSHADTVTFQQQYPRELGPCFIGAQHTIHSAFIVNQGFTSGWMKISYQETCQVSKT